MTYPNINNQFRNIGNDFRSNIPHIYLGNKGFSTQNKPNFPQNKYKPLPRQENEAISQRNALNEGFSTREEKIIEKLRSWSLIILLVIVGGYASYRIIKMFFLGG